MLCQFMVFCSFLIKCPLKGKRQLQLMLQEQRQTKANQYAMIQRYKACMILAAVGDAMGYYQGNWEFTYNGQEIHREMMSLTNKQGIKGLKIDESNFPYSDDTVMHIATAQGLIRSSPTASLREICSNIACQYKKCMKHMQGRAPGGTCIRSTNLLWHDGTNWDKIPFSKNAGGCGAAMRAACIGLYYPYDFKRLLEVSIQSGRTTHHNPLGYLGSYVAALFTAFAVQDIHPHEWLSLLMSKHLPQAKKYVQSNRQGQQNFSNGDWKLFQQLWTTYAKIRHLSLQTPSVPKFPQIYGVKQREEQYHKLSINGWPGALGVDSVLIAYDALLSSLDQQNRKGQTIIEEVPSSSVNLWEELCLRGVLHGGDNDSTGTIAGAWYGALYGFKEVYPNNYQKVQGYSKLITLGDEIYRRAFPLSENDKNLQKAEYLSTGQTLETGTKGQQIVKEQVK